MAEPRLCSIPGCGKPHFGHGWCNTHYARWRRHGDPLSLTKTPNGIAQDFYRETVLTYEGDDCLIWPYARTAGYGVLGNERVHRLVCAEENGPPPTPDHHAAHSCGNGHLGCVNRHHLRWATPTENNADKVIHGTNRLGEERYNAKLTPMLVRQIRDLYGRMPQRQIATHLGVSFSAVKNVLSGNAWSWVE